ncbi:MAG: hypothetical protein J6P60_04785 [Lachnospiraceae bacterium]|nr:hypothetical protein [Lachnospiraceae bacterium]
MTVGGVSLDTRLYAGMTNANYEKTSVVTDQESESFFEVVVNTPDFSERSAVTPLVSSASPQEIYGQTSYENSGTRKVYGALLARENANTGTTESDIRLAVIKIEANAKASQERAQRAAMFNTTTLMEKVKSERDFLTGKHAVGSLLDIAQ